MLLKRLVILVGLRNSGKTTFAKFLVSKGYKSLTIAQPLVDLAQDIFGFDDYEEFKISKVVGKLTGRDFICKLGDYTHELYEDMLVVNAVDQIDSSHEYVVVTDVRTESELACLHLSHPNTQIVVVHIKRDGINPQSKEEPVHRTERLATDWHDKPIDEIYIPYDKGSRINIIRSNSRDSETLLSLTGDMS